ncbi:NUDIX domain-containing protein [Erythrobacter sp.]|jgi:8-oxo-dGTP pyrophosphatase MutT (NUDIX family)|uniref:NUDIX domain-containing protein n=1 Tax=Erythrobacter sp. TaxID=1042 RepID=UPI002E9A6FD8|nr:NUDIX domain-containing protein [Erythrobacter sp.]
MLRLIEALAERILPAPIHRALMPLAHRIRHRWRRFSGQPIAGVSVLLTNDAGEVLLLRHSYGPNVWGLPGGGLKRAESPEDCARREVREELGIVLCEVKAIGTLEEELSGAPHTAHLIAATTRETPRPDGREVVEARFFAPGALPYALGDVTQRRIEAWRTRA